MEENKKKGNLALEEIINSELEDNPFSITYLSNLFYEIQKEYPHVPLIEVLVNSAILQLITLANKNYRKKHYVEILKTAILYLEWVSKDIKKQHNKNLKDYFNLLEIYKETNKKREKLIEIGKIISEKFSFRDIFLSHKNSTVHSILGFIQLNYENYIKDIDMIIAIAYRFANLEIKKECENKNHD